MTGAALPPDASASKTTRRSIAFAILTLALGAGGGWLATQINLPLPWMIGAMVATTIGSLGGLDLFMYRWVRGPNVAVLGVMLGSSFTPAILGRFGDWIATIAGLALYVALNAEHFPFGAPGGIDLDRETKPWSQRSWLWREYGNRVGGWRLAALFDDLALPVGLIINSATYEHCPDLVARFRAR